MIQPNNEYFGDGIFFKNECETIPSDILYN